MDTCEWFWEHFGHGLNGYVPVTQEDIRPGVEIYMASAIRQRKRTNNYARVNGVVAFTVDDTPSFEEDGRCWVRLREVNGSPTATRVLTVENFLGTSKVRSGAREIHTYMTKTP